MKTISIWQPWASAIPAGLKKIEIRGWHPQRQGIQFPLRIAIHAAKRWTGDEMAFYAETVLRDPQARAAFAAIGIDGPTDPLPLGAIIAQATLYGCVLTEDLLVDGVTELEQRWGNFGPGRYGWLLRDIQAMTPVPCVGRQGFFDWEPL